MSEFLERDPERMRLGRLIALTGQRLTRYWQYAVATRTDLSRTALVTLAAVAENGELTHREAARHCCVTPATLTPVVDALEADGLLLRRRDEADRRVVHLTITEDGSAALRRAREDIGAELAAVVPPADPDDDAVIRKYLIAVLDRLDAERGST